MMNGSPEGIDFSEYEKYRTTADRILNIPAGGFPAGCFADDSPRSRARYLASVADTCPATADDLERFWQSKAQQEADDIAAVPDEVTTVVSTSNATVIEVFDSLPRPARKRPLSPPPLSTVKDPDWVWGGPPLAQRYVAKVPPKAMSSSRKDGTPNLRRMTASISFSSTSSEDTTRGQDSLAELSAHQAQDDNACLDAAWIPAKRP
eukprot:TRINITY_DN58144_c0_g2_i1.p1 TRINITY_DN58144_c0_g2~~TRINITY_DN58144_c0_g2_i1.p1  ORF type:complete len:206 (-),score=22.21 TRINITY_DN58144_c0_g2_i1:50-667(-)